MRRAWLAAVFHEVSPDQGSLLILPSDAGDSGLGPWRFAGWRSGRLRCSLGSGGRWALGVR
jgi:hypothetical protein